MVFNGWIAPEAIVDDEEHENAFMYLEEDEHDDRRAEREMEA